MFYATAKRLFDLVSSVAALAAVSPVLAVAAAGILIASPGPLLYRARRAGRGGDPFVMYKLRTMHWRPAEAGKAITGAHDPRVFWFGSLLRRSKIDELPQLLNVLRGEMSIVGPRAEDVTIVERHFSDVQRQTLTVLPGLASPGSLFNYTHWDDHLSTDDPEQAYIRDLLPVKLALELVYVSRRSFAYDLQIIGRTVRTIGQIASGRREFPDPPEMDEALAILGRTRTASAASARVTPNACRAGNR